MSASERVSEASESADDSVSSETTLVRRWEGPRMGPPVELESEDEMRRWMEAVPAPVPHDPSERIPFAYPIPGAQPRPVPATPAADGRVSRPDVEMEHLMASEDAPTKRIEVPTELMTGQPDEKLRSEPGRILVRAVIKPASKTGSTSSSAGSGVASKPVQARVRRPSTSRPPTHRQPSLEAPITRRQIADGDEDVAPRRKSLPQAASGSPTHRFFAGTGGIAVLAVLAYVSWPKDKAPVQPRVGAPMVAVSNATADDVPQAAAAAVPEPAKSPSKEAPVAAATPAAATKTAAPTIAAAPQKLAHPRAVPEGTAPERAAAFARLPLADDDGPPLGGIGEGGIHVDRLELGTTYERGECDAAKARYTLGTDTRINACFRVVHPRRNDEVMVLWQQDGQTLRRAAVTVGSLHSYRTRAFLTLRDEYVGSWTVRVMSHDGVELANASFVVEDGSRSVSLASSQEDVPSDDSE